MLEWNVIHLTSSLRYPQGNAHAEKVVQMVKAMYAKCRDVKLGLLLLKTTPVVSSQNRDQ